MAAKIPQPEDLGAEAGRTGNKTAVSLVKLCAGHFLIV